MLLLALLSFPVTGCDFSAQNAKIQADNAALRSCQRSGHHAAVRIGDYSVSYSPGNCFNDPSQPYAPPCIPSPDRYCANATYRCR